LIAQPADLGGIVRHYYYGRFCRGFHAKDDLFNIISGFLSRSAVGASRQKTAGSKTRAGAMPKRLVSPPSCSQRGWGRSKGKILLDFIWFISRL
jgi:hypothetical protein